MPQEHTAPTFGEWLLAQVNREDPVGDAAREYEWLCERGRGAQPGDDPEAAIDLLTFHYSAWPGFGPDTFAVVWGAAEEWRRSLPYPAESP